MEQVILTNHQLKVIQIVAAEEKLKDFYLTGGTALAVYYLHHRRSDDLDYFISDNPDGLFLETFTQQLKDNLGADDVRFERKYDRRQFFFIFPDYELKVEFTKYPFPRLEPLQILQGVRVDSLTDIGANKIMTILDRLDPKDFVDLFFILQNNNLDTLRKNAEKKFGIKIGDIFLGGALAKVKKIKALPVMIKPLTIDEVKDFFSKQARGLEGNIFH